MKFKKRNIQIVDHSTGQTLDFPTFGKQAGEEAINELEQNVDNKIAELKSLVGTPLKASTASAMNNRDKIYVYTGNETGYTNGHWYYYDGTNWADGGVYNSTAVETDKTLSVENVPADAKKTGDEISQLKSDLSDVKNYIGGVTPIEFELIQDEYVTKEGNIETFKGWDRTDYIPVTAGEVLYYSWSVISAYNCFFDANKNKIGTNIFMNNNGDDIPLTVISGASYVMFSNTRAGMASLTLKRYKNEKGSPEVILVDKIVALQDEQFDIHYDNVLANNSADNVPYKEVFGSFSGVGMEEFVRINSSATGESGGTIRFADRIPDAFNNPALPLDVIKKHFDIITIPKTAGDGLDRKVLLIGDSWTAPGKYALELQSLFASADEPMGITLLGTLGTGGAYVGPENGYHEGHGGFSAKTFCTEATYNTYANAFYNPTSQTFDFAYYMSNCGYASVDDVFINLGINDVAETQDYDEILTYWDIMVNSIKAYNSNVKVFIGLCGLPAQYKYSTNNNNSNRTKALRLMFHQKLMEHYGNKESDGIIIVPLHLSIDSKHDFPTVQRARSFRDSTLVDYCTDNVHPSDIAYNKLADRIRTYIKYAETL